METLVDESKRIKVEHSYMCFDASKLEPVITIKQEDPLGLSEENDVVHTMKIEINDDADSLVKTEPTETVGGEYPDYPEYIEYLVVPSESKIPPQNTLTLNTVRVSNLSIGSDAEIINIKNFTVGALASEDPLLLADNKIQVDDEVEKPRQKRKRKRKGKNLNTNTPQSSEDEETQEKDNLPKQTTKLKADYESAIEKQMVLQAELAGRKISEAVLKEKNTELQSQLTESTKKLKKSAVLIEDLNQKIAQMERELSVKFAFTEQLKKNLNQKMEKADKLKQRQFEQQKSDFEKQLKGLKLRLDSATLRLSSKEAQLKQLDVKHADLSLAIRRLNSSFELQKNELNDKTKKLHDASQALNNSKESNKDCNQRINLLMNGLALARSENEELQKDKARIKQAMTQTLANSQNSKERIEELTKNLALAKTKIEELEKHNAWLKQAVTNSIKSSQNSNQRIGELTKDLTLAKSKIEELQNTILVEQKTSRFLIKEKDDLLQKEEAKFQEVDKDLLEHKIVIESLTNALTHQIEECRMQKETVKRLKLNDQKLILELKSKMIEMEQELKNKVCEYCGLS